MELHENRSTIAEARELVLRYGRAVTAWQILHPAIRRWFSEDRQAVVGFVQYRRVRVVA